MPPLIRQATNIKCDFPSQGHVQWVIMGEPAVDRGTGGLLATLKATSIIMTTTDLWLGIQ